MRAAISGMGTNPDVGRAASMNSAMDSDSAS